MVPLQPDETSDEDSASHSEVGQQPNGHAELDLTTLHNGVDEQEYHTSDSEDRTGDDLSRVDDEDEVNNEDRAVPPTAPLLPLNILQTRPPPTQAVADIPWDRLTRKQKQARRNRSRKMKKAAMELVRSGIEGNGVLEAGRAAQSRRGVLTSATTDRVRGGRIEKRERKEVVSGRQRVLEERKRLVGKDSGRNMRPSTKKMKTAKSKR